MRDASWRERVDPATVVTAVVLGTLLLSGPIGAVDLTGSPAELGEGTASVTVVQPDSDQFRMTTGRFGADVLYTRLPDLVVDVESVTGQPRLVYSLTVPGLEIDRSEQRLIRSPGRLRVPMRDHALPPEPVAGAPEIRRDDTYSGRLVVRVQSFAGQHVVVNRSIEVTTP